MSAKVSTKLCLYVEKNHETKVYKKDDLVYVFMKDGRQFTGRIACVFDMCFELDCSSAFHSNTVRINVHDIDDMFAVKTYDEIKGGTE